MERFVRMFRYDPERDPTVRLRLEYHPDHGLANLACERTHLEQVENPDANHVQTLNDFDLTTREMRWLAGASAELATIMEHQDAAAQAEVDRLRAQRGEHDGAK